MLDLNFLDNKYMSSGLTLFLVLYAGLAAPQLPERIAELFENEIFKLFIMFMIAYMSTKDTTVALLVAIGFAISIQTLTKQKISSQLISLLENGSIVDESTNENEDGQEKHEDNNLHLANNYDNHVLEEQTKTVTFNEDDNQYYEDEEPHNDFYKMSPYQHEEEQDDEIQDYNQHNLDNYIGGVANQMNRLSNNSVYSMDNDNGLGWGSYSEGTSEYAIF